MTLDALLDEADLARMQSDYESAAAGYEQVLRVQASSMRAAAGLGICLQKLGRAAQALPYLAGVATEGCTDPVALACLGKCYFGMGKMEVAVTAFRRAASLDPNPAQALVLLAHALVRLGSNSEAETHLREAIELEPNLATAHDLMAFMLPQMGRFDEAKESARTASALDPQNAAYCVRYVYGGKVTEDDLEFVDRLECMAISGTLGVQDSIRVEYGLGKALEDLGRYEGSLRHYIKANALAGRQLRQKGQAFDPAAHAREIDYLIQSFSAESLRERAATGIDSDLPIFIVGMMRSGTTLTEQILSSHPEVSGAGELSYWVEAAPRTLNSDPSVLQATAREYVRMLGEIGPGKSRVCDKMPQNYVSLGPIHAALPNARFIHCRRDPRDTCLSIFTIPFTFHPPFAYSIKNIASAYRQYQRVMAHWREVLPPDRLLEVDYEDLVANQEAVSRKLIEFVGLKWDESCLHPENNPRIVNTPSRWQVRQPVYGKSVARWKRFSPWLDTLLPDWSSIHEL